MTFSVEYGGRTIVVEDVPARVDSETGEQFFSPETADKLQAIVWSGRLPDRVHYAAAGAKIATEHENELTARLNRVYRDEAKGVDPVLKLAQQRSIGTEHW